MYIFFGMVLARDQNENENQYQKGLRKNKRISHKRDWDNRKVYEVKVVLMVGALVTYRCECLGTILALIHPYKQEDFDT